MRAVGSPGGGLGGKAAAEGRVSEAAPEERARGGVEPAEKVRRGAEAGRPRCPGAAGWRSAPLRCGGRGGFPGGGEELSSR